MKKSVMQCVVAAACAVFSIPGAQAGTYAKTQYPIVMVSGGGGFVNIGGFFPYYYGIPEALRSEGATVLLPEVSGLASAEIRGEQLRAYLANYFAIHPEVKKVNLISHSFGAQTIRYVDAVMPGRIASVTSVHGTNNGNVLADVYTRAASIPLVGSALDAAVRTIGNTIGTIANLLSSGEILPQDALANMREISTQGTAAFNSKFPAGAPSTPCGQGAAVVNGVRYYSWGGTSSTRETSRLDPSSTVLSLTGALSRSLGVSETDGVVGRCESHLGQVIRDNYFMDHLDAMNHVYGLVSIFEVNPKTLYLAQANRLKKAGL